MPVSGTLRRLLHVRSLQEEQQRLALESSLVDLHELEHALSQVQERQRRSREHIATSADPSDRVAAQVESECAARHAAALLPLIGAAQRKTSCLRDQFLQKRVERRQVETVISAIEVQDANAADRRDQQTIDDWYSGRGKRRKPSAAPPVARSQAKKP